MNPNAATFNPAGAARSSSNNANMNGGGGYNNMQQPHNNNFRPTGGQFGGGNPQQGGGHSAHLGRGAPHQQNQQAPSHHNNTFSSPNGAGPNNNAVNNRNSVHLGGNNMMNNNNYNGGYNNNNGGGYNNNGGGYNGGSNSRGMNSNSRPFSPNNSGPSGNYNGGYNNNNGGYGNNNNYNGGGYNGNNNGYNNNNSGPQHNNNYNNGNNNNYGNNYSNNYNNGNGYQQQNGNGYQQQNNNNGNQMGQQNNNNNNQQSQPPRGPPVILLFDADGVERQAIATHLTNTNNYIHIVTDDDDNDTATVHYKEFADQIQNEKNSPDFNSNRGWLIEVKLTYNYTEMMYYFDALRNAQLFPTHIVYIDHAAKDIPHSSEYGHEQRTHHPLAFDTCSLLFQSCEKNFLYIAEAMDKDGEGGMFNAPAFKQITDFIATPAEPLKRVPEYEPVGVFKHIALHPNVNVLTSMTDRLCGIFECTELFASPVYVLDYSAISRNSFQLPSYWSTVDLNGINTVLAKIDNQYYVFFPKFIAVAILDEEMVPEPLRKMTADGSNAAAGADASGKPSALTSPTSADGGAAASPSTGNVAWVINATICYSDDVISTGEEENGNATAVGDCTIYAKDIIYANGQIVAGHSFAARQRLLKELISENPANDKEIIVRQRYYPALETDSIFRKIEQNAAASAPTAPSSPTANANAAKGKNVAAAATLAAAAASPAAATAAAGNGVWFINPGKAQLRGDSSWNFMFALGEGGFDARLWNAEQDDNRDWTFDVLVTMSNGGEEVIGKVCIDADSVERDTLNDGQIVRLLVRKEMPVEAPPAPAPKGKGKNAKQPAPAPVKAEPTYVFTYVSRQHWTFMPTSQDPLASRLTKADLLEALSYLK